MPVLVMKTFADYFVIRRPWAAWRRGMQPEATDAELSNLIVQKARLVVVQNVIGAAPEHRRRVEGAAFDLLGQLERLLNKVFGPAERSFVRGHRLPLRLEMAIDHIQRVLAGPGEPAENA